jgi:hypothetical protein
MSSQSPRTVQIMSRIQREYGISKTHLHLLPMLFRGGSHYIYDDTQHRIFEYHFLSRPPTLKVETSAQIWKTYQPELKRLGFMRFKRSPKKIKHSPKRKRYSPVRNRNIRKFRSRRKSK